MRIAISALAMQSKAGYLKAGISRYCWALTDALVEVANEHELILFVAEDFDAPESWKSAKNVQVVHARGRLARYKSLWDLVHASFAAKKYKPDVWLTTAHAIPLWGPCKKVLTVHDLFVLTNPDLYTRRSQLVFGWAMRNSIPRADHLLCVSQHTMGEVGKIFGVPNAKMTVTHLGPGNFVSPIARDAVSDERIAAIGVPYRKFLFTLSTLEPRKNFARLLEACGILFQKPEYADYGLVVGGGTGWKSSGIFEAFEASGLGDRVHFLGYVDDQDLPALFARCEAYVIPSLIEGFGITVLEALALGAPVVCSSTGALPEVGGELATYFDPYSVEDIARAIAMRLNTLDDRDAIVAAGFARAKEFSWTKTARETLAALQEVCR